ncbi:ABC transporter ATP-binding protein [Candidatus Entotheonella palauensis]|uniref:ABC transporter ATP-binding protein n=1 Tax=Candidatus Entotheonella palauensis TaxID=93172 RepID=UPI000B7EF74C|nr:ABC transporter ATP-binding protein [Candidatus Entotheonella palauensis]
MLVLDQIVKTFGGIRAVDGVSFEVNRGEIVALIGPNGSGKSTTLNLITRVYPLTSGRITFDHRDLTQLATHKIIHTGIARTFQNIRLFNNLTVWENVWVAARQDHGHTGWQRWFRKDRATRDWIDEILGYCHLDARRHDLAGNLSFGEARRLEVARGMATNPTLLMLDEPAAGMSGSEIGELIDTIRTLQQRGATILLIDHVLDLVMNVAERVVVLNFGRKLAEGPPAQIQANAEVRAAYLGTKET